MCTHDWQPIPGWYARYRCTHCSVLGCKFGVVVAPHGGHRSNEIAPYRCQAQCCGAKCNEPAVHGEGGANKLRCAAHRPGQAARARRELAAAKAAQATQATAATVVEPPVAPSGEGPAAEAA
jgi:hypothetical protein